MDEATRKHSDVVQFSRIDSRKTVRSPGSEFEYELNEYTYGALVPDRTHPLSNVSVANSALSIDPWVGCAWQCAYCHVQGSLEDLVDNLAMPRSTRRRTGHTFEDILEALVDHPFFKPNETVISIGTASTEPLAPGQVVDSTFKIMDILQDMGLRNPFWIVTKRGMPLKYSDRLSRICDRGSRVMLSMCWAGNSPELEPVQNNRFLNVDEAYSAGATIAWYMRPLAPSWGMTTQRLEEMITEVASTHGHLLSAVVPGALRWTPGVDRAVRDVHKLDLKTRQAQVETKNEKEELPDEFVEKILNVCRLQMPEVPVYFKSSCALTHMLESPSIAAVDALSSGKCKASRCPEAQRKLCAKGNVHSMSVGDAQRVADRLQLPLTVVDWADRSSMPTTEPPLENESYAVSQAFENDLNR